jgi:hypothetical protein
MWAWLCDGVQEKTARKGGSLPTACPSRPGRQARKARASSPSVLPLSRLPLRQIFPIGEVLACTFVQRKTRLVDDGLAMSWKIARLRLPAFSMSGTHAVSCEWRPSSA